VKKNDTGYLKHLEMDTISLENSKMNTS